METPCLQFIQLRPIAGMKYYLSTILLTESTPQEIIRLGQYSCVFTTPEYTMFRSIAPISVKLDGPVVLNTMKQYVLETTYADWYIYEDCSQSVVSPESVNVRNSNKVSGLTNLQVAELTPEQITALTGPEIAALTLHQISAFTYAQMASLRASHLGSMSPEQLAAFSAEQLYHLPFTSLQGITDKQLAAMSHDQVKRIVEADEIKRIEMTTKIPYKEYKRKVSSGSPPILHSPEAVALGCIVGQVGCQGAFACAQGVGACANGIGACANAGCTIMGGSKRKTKARKLRRKLKKASRKHTRR